MFLGFVVVFFPVGNPINRMMKSCMSCYTPKNYRKLTVWPKKLMVSKVRNLQIPGCRRIGFFVVTLWLMITSYWPIRSEFRFKKKMITGGFGCRKNGTASQPLLSIFDWLALFVKMCSQKEMIDFLWFLMWLFKTACLPLHKALFRSHDLGGVSGKVL